MPNHSPTPGELKSILDQKGPAGAIDAIFVRSNNVKRAHTVPNDQLALEGGQIDLDVRIVQQHTQELRMLAVESLYVGTPRRGGGGGKTEGFL